MVCLRKSILMVLLMAVSSAYAGVSVDRLATASVDQIHDIMVKEPKQWHKFSKSYYNELYKIFDCCKNIVQAKEDKAKLKRVQKILKNLYNYKIATNPVKGVIAEVASVYKDISKPVYPFRLKIALLSHAIASNASVDTVNERILDFLHCWDEVATGRKKFKYHGCLVSKTYVEQFVNACLALSNQGVFSPKGSDIASLSEVSVHMPYGVVTKDVARYVRERRINALRWGLCIGSIAALVTSVAVGGGFLANWFYKKRVYPYVQDVSTDVRGIIKNVNDISTAAKDLAEGKFDNFATNINNSVTKKVQDEKGVQKDVLDDEKVEKIGLAAAAIKRIVDKLFPSKPKVQSEGGEREPGFMDNLVKALVDLINRLALQKDGRNIDQAKLTNNLNAIGGACKKFNENFMDDFKKEESNGGNGSSGGFSSKDSGPSAVEILAREGRLLAIDLLKKDNSPEGDINQNNVEFVRKLIKNNENIEALIDMGTKLGGAVKKITSAFQTLGRLLGIGKEKQNLVPVNSGNSTNVQKQSVPPPTMGDSVVVKLPGGNPMDNLNENYVSVVVEENKENDDKQTQGSSTQVVQKFEEGVKILNDYNSLLKSFEVIKPENNGSKKD